MRKSLLGAGLMLLTVALWVGPLVAAFQAHGWDLGETLMPGGGQVDEVEDKIGGLMGDNEISGDEFTLTESSIDGRDFTLTFDFDSSLDFDFTFKEFRTAISDGTVENLGRMELGREVKVPSDGAVELDFIGRLTEQGKDRIEDAHGGEVPGGIGFSGGTLKLEVSGITIDTSLEDSGEGGGV